MKEKSRIRNSFFNISAGMITNIISILISFLQRVVFLKILDATYLGVSGLFSNILLIFSLAELGIGAALTQMFYRPFAEEDYQKLSVVTYTTKRLLNLVGIVIIVLTVLFTPFLQWFVNDINVVPNMRLIFFLYGISSSITYFAGYYRTIITANQEAYRLLKIDFVWKVLTFIVLSSLLIVSRNFIVYLLAQVAMNFALNIVVRNIVRNRYNEIDYKCKEFLPKEEMKHFGKNVYGLSMNRLATVITQGTDNIVISKFLNLKIVGYASNYTMIIQAVTTLLEALFGPLLASVGNYCISKSKEEQYELFQNLSFLAFWLYGFCSITCFCLVDIFIELVFGSEYVIPQIATFFLCLDIFCIGITRVATLFRTAQGIFWYGRYRPLLQALVNLISSILLIALTNQLWAVYAGTVLSRLVITVWYEPFIVMKYGFEVKSYKYLLKEVSYFGVYLIALVISRQFLFMLHLQGITKLVLVALLCIGIINLMFLLFFFKRKEFKYWIGFVKNIKH